MSDEQLIVRRPAVAGLFYPAAPDALREAIHQAFAAARPASPGVPVPKAIVVPHAGYVFSGPTAAKAFARLPTEGVRRVILLGPSHHFGFSGGALPAASTTAFSTTARPAVMRRSRSPLARYSGETNNDTRSPGR